MDADRLHLLAVSPDARNGQPALAAFAAIVVLLMAVGPALYFTWHAIGPVQRRRYKTKFIEDVDHGGGQ